MTKKRTAAVFALCICAVLLLTFCAGCTDTSDSGNTDISNMLVYAGESEDTINPLLNNHEELPDLIFSGLMKYDGDGTPIVDLAESYTYDPDTLVYTFDLRKGVT